MPTIDPSGGSYSLSIAANASVMYDLTSSGGDYIFESSSPTDVDIYVEVWTAAGSFVAYDDDSGPGWQFSLGAHLPAGNYEVYVGAYSTAVAGDATMTVTYLPPPPPPDYVVGNDTFATAFDVGAVTNEAGVSTGFDNTGASDEGGGMPGGRSIFYRFTTGPDLAGPLLISAIPSPGTEAHDNVELRLYTASGLSVAAAARYLSLDPNGNGAASYFTLDPNTTYVVMLYFPSGLSGYWTQGSLTVKVDPDQPTNTSIAYADVLPPNSGTLTDLGSDAFVYLYWTFEPTITGGGYFVLDGPHQVIDIRMWTGTGWSNPLATSSTVLPDGTIRLSYNVVAGERYLISTRRIGAGKFSLRWMVRTAAEWLTEYLSVPELVVVTAGVRQAHAIMETQSKHPTDDAATASVDQPLMHDELLSGQGRTVSTAHIQADQDLHNDASIAMYAADIHVRGATRGDPNTGHPRYQADPLYKGTGIHHRNPLGYSAWTTNDGDPDTTEGIAGNMNFAEVVTELRYQLFSYQGDYTVPAVGTNAWYQNVQDILNKSFFWDPHPNQPESTWYWYESEQRYVMGSWLSNLWRNNVAAFEWADGTVPAEPDDYKWQLDLSIRSLYYVRNYVPLSTGTRVQDTGNVGWSITLRDMGNNPVVLPVDSLGNVTPAEGWKGNLDHWPVLEQRVMPADDQVFLIRREEPYVKGVWFGRILNSDYQEGRVFEVSGASHLVDGTLFHDNMAQVSIAPKIVLTVPSFRVGTWTEDIHPLVRQAPPMRQRARQDGLAAGTGARRGGSEPEMRQRSVRRGSGVVW